MKIELLLPPLHAACRPFPCTSLLGYFICMLATKILQDNEVCVYDSCR